MGPARSRCSARRSARTSTARSRASRTPTRSCRAGRASATRTPSSAMPSTGSRAGSSPPGSGKGDRVGVWGPNRAEWAIVQYATAKLGVILVNVNPAYRTSELEYALGQSGCRLLFASQEVKGSDFVSMVDQVRPNLPELEQAIFFETAEWEDISSAGASAGRGPRGRRAARLRRADQHPVHERYDGIPEGRDAQPQQHPQQWSLPRAAARPIPSAIASASRCRFTTASGW